MDERRREGCVYAAARRREARKGLNDDRRQDQIGTCESFRHRPANFRTQTLSSWMLRARLDYARALRKISPLTKTNVGIRRWILNAQIHSFSSNASRTPCARTPLSDATSARRNVSTAPSWPINPAKGKLSSSSPEERIVIPSDSQRKTIYALATPPGRGGVAVIRVSGPEARVVCARIVRPRSLRGSSLSDGAKANGAVSDECAWEDMKAAMQHRKMVRCAVVDPSTGEELDDGLAVFFKGTSMHLISALLYLLIEFIQHPTLLRPKTYWSCTSTPAAPSSPPC